MSVRVAVAMLKDGRKGLRKPRHSFRYVGQIGELSPGYAGVLLTFQRPHIVSELLGSKITMRCVTCGDETTAVFPMPYVVPDDGDAGRVEWLRSFATAHKAKGCRIYGLDAA